MSRRVAYRGVKLVHLPGSIAGAVSKGVSRRNGGAWANGFTVVDGTYVECKKNRMHRKSSFLSLPYQNEHLSNVCQCSGRKPSVSP